MRCPKCSLYISLDPSHPNVLGPHEHNETYEKDGKGCGKSNYEIRYPPDGQIVLFCKFCEIGYINIVCDCGGTIQGKWLRMEDGPSCPSCGILGSTGLEGKSKCNECGWLPTPPVLPPKEKSPTLSLWVNLLMVIIITALSIAAFLAFR